MTIKEIARLAGVSISTVSKIMNNKDESISADTREHVMKIIKEYNYRPYASSIAPANKTFFIGVILRTASGVRTLAPGLLTAAGRLGYTILLRDSALSIENERKNISFLLQSHVDGIIWEPVSEESMEFISAFEKAQIPFLFTNIEQTGAYNPAFKEMGYFAAEKLIENHHEAIACMSGKGFHESAFYEGYRQCLLDHHLPVYEELTAQNAEDPFYWIPEHTFSGILLFHYKDALRLYDRAVTRHYSIPAELSVISLEEHPEDPSAYPPISSIPVPYQEFGEKLMEEIIRIVEKKADEVSFCFPFVLNHTRSVAAPYDLKLKSVISLGSINIDNYLHFETLPHTGKSVTTGTSSVYVGGKCANEGIGIARLGHRVSLIGRVGNDTDADLIYETLKNNQIDTFGVIRSNGYKTGQAYIFVQDDGDSMISMMAGANQAVTKSDIEKNERLFVQASYCLMQTEIPFPAIIRACELAKKHHVMTVLKPSACTALPDTLLHLTDILVPNFDELNAICPGSNSLEEKAASLLSRGIRTVIVTLGAQGCYIKSEATETYLPAAPFTSIDNTGAGDAFISALVSYLLYGYDILSAAKIASFAAGFSTTTQGTIPALIDKETLETLIRQREPALLKNRHNHTESLPPDTVLHTTA